MSEKRYYSVKRTLSDTSNGINLRLGDCVQTNCEKWVARMGSALESASPPEDGTAIVVISSTLEDGVPVAPKGDAETQKQRKAISRKKASEMLDAEEDKDK